jgi:hypothetical protein
LVLLAAASSAPGQEPLRVDDPAIAVDGFSLPESVVSIGRRHFVSNMGKKLEPLAFDGDGFISEIDDNGGGVDLHAFPRDASKLNAPKGLAVVDNLLLVADIDRIVGFDLTTGQTAFEARMDTDAPSLLNDIEPETENAVIATDTIRGALYRLDLRTRRFAVLATGMPGANGVTIASDRTSAIVVGVGNDFAGGNAFTVSLRHPGGPDKWDAPFGILDGIALLPDGRFVISDWVAVDRPADGQLIVCDERHHCSAGNLPARQRGPADISFDDAGGRLWIPLMLENRVEAFDLR